MELNFIYTNKNYTEKGYLKHASLDIDIGKYGISDNDFEITASISELDAEFDDGSIFFSYDTEWGGIVYNKKIDTAKNEITLKGKTFRGILEKEFVQPPTDESHLTLSGDANTCIRDLIANRFDDLFVVDEIGSSGIEINYDVRDLNLLEALEKALGKSKAKLDIKYQADGKVHLKAVKISDLSDTLQYDNNYQVNMIVETKDKAYNHILILGKGELTERVRVNLYLQADGSWSEVVSSVGMDRKTYKHEDANTENIDELKENAIEKVEDANGSDTLDISFSSDDADLFDIVSAKEQITGISFKEPITQKILKGNIDNLSVSYKVGE